MAQLYKQIQFHLANSKNIAFRSEEFMLVDIGFKAPTFWQTNHHQDKACLNKFDDVHFVETF